jgi:hypothetical protein
MMPLARVQRRVLRLDDAVGQGPEDVGGLPGVVVAKGAVADAVFDDLGQQAQVPLPDLGDLLHHQRRQLADHRLVLDRPEDLEVVRVLDVVPEVEVARPPELLHRRQGRRQHVPELRFEDVSVVSEDGDVELGLAVEVTVEGALGDAGLLGHGVQVRCHEAVAEEDLLGGIEDAAMGPLPFLRSPRDLARLPVLGRFRHLARSLHARSP